MCDFPLKIRNPHYQKNVVNPLAPSELKDYLTQANSLYIQVPCNKCADCKRQRANDWFLRLFFEQKTSYSSYFVTLTYEVTPRTFNGLRTARIQDASDYIRRLRRIEKTNKAIKYYAVTEYGEKVQRPHIHLIIFNVTERDNLYKAWTKGIVDVGTLIPERIRYVTGYIEKKIGIPQTDYDDREVEKSRMSKHLGQYAVLVLKDYLIKNKQGYVKVNGATFRIPRYIKEKIFTDKTLYNEISYNNYTRAVKVQNNIIKNFDSIEDFESNQRAIIERNNKKSRYVQDLIN